MVRRGSGRSGPAAVVPRGRPRRRRGMDRRRAVWSVVVGFLRQEDEPLAQARSIVDRIRRRAVLETDFLSLQRHHHRPQMIAHEEQIRRDKLVLNPAVRSPLHRANEAIEPARMIEREFRAPRAALLRKLRRLVPPELQVVKAADVVPLEVRGGAGLSGARIENCTLRVHS